MATSIARVMLSGSRLAVEAAVFFVISLAFLPETLTSGFSGAIKGKSQVIDSKDK
jgi:hypothetical protein